MTDPPPTRQRATVSYLRDDTESRARASPCDHGLIRCPFCARGLAAA